LNDKVIILFTSAFPFGLGEQFIETELKFLAKSFSDVFIFPYHYGGSMEIRKGIPENATVYKPFRDEHHSIQKLLYKGIFSARTFFPYCEDLFKNPGILISRKKFSLWIRTMLNCRMILDDQRLLDIIQKFHDRLIFYFYWGHRPSGIAVELKKLNRPIIVRFHGTDLYKEMALNRNYIPFRENVLKSISHAVCISDHGASYLRRNYNLSNVQLSVHRLGTTNHGTYPWKASKTLRIISCSMVDENKRIGLIAQAISCLDFPVRWMHIGNGPLMPELSQQCKTIYINDLTINLPGRMTNQEVHRVYQQEQFDLFINVSKSEGVPFSIMEALSYSIPVIATAAGGTPEIIDSSCGELIPVEFSIAQLSSHIQEFHLLEESQKMILRMNARKRWEMMCDAERNYQEFATFLEKI
jgi:colanic acid/amylovoran biosynthesis glycosyltransferase